MTLTIHEIPEPGPDDLTPHPWLVGMSAVRNAFLTASMGHLDLSRPLSVEQAAMQASEARQRRIWVATRDLDGRQAAAGDVLGYLEARLPLLENQTLVLTELIVHPDHRGAGIGTALLQTLTTALPDRTIQLSQTITPDATNTPGALTSAVGLGAVDPRLPGPRFALGHGFVLEQVYQGSTLTVNEESLRHAARLLVDAQGAADGYTLVQWTDVTPQDCVQDLLRLFTDMSTDTPTGGIGYEAKVWSPERLNAQEERRRQAGLTTLWTGARDSSSGQLVAYTTLVWPRERATGVSQDDTLVRRDHRGHRLGLLVKAANLAYLHRVNPDAARVNTWNAHENGPMLDINIALGFRPTIAVGEWQRSAQ